MIPLQVLKSFLIDRRFKTSNHLLCITYSYVSGYTSSLLDQLIGKMNVRVTADVDQLKTKDRVARGERIWSGVFYDRNKVSFDNQFLEAETIFDGPVHVYGLDSCKVGENVGQ